LLSIDFKTFHFEARGQATGRLGHEILKRAREPFTSLSKEIIIFGWREEVICKEQIAQIMGEMPSNEPDRGVDSKIYSK
jgi:hypothetical protein